MKLFGLYSAGGFAREAIGYLQSALSQQEQGPYQIVFIDDDPDKVGRLQHGSPIITYADFLKHDHKVINIAFADPKLRRAKAEQAEQDGLDFYSIFAGSYHQGGNVTIGAGAIFAHNAMVTCDAQIGRHFHCNIYSYVNHDCIVGDYVTFGPRVSLNGRIVVQDGVYIGSDATILPGKEHRPITIGAGAIIGAGAVVTRDVEPGTTVVGSPARPLKRP